MVATLSCRCTRTGSWPSCWRRRGCWCLCLVLLLVSRPKAALAGAEPAWVWPWEPTGARPAFAVVVVAAVATGALAGALVHPLTGVGVGVSTVIGLLVARGPGLLAVGALSGLGLAAAFTIAKQWRNDYPPDFGWPGFFGAAHHLAWIGLLLLVASVVTGELRRRAAPPSSRR